MTNAISFNPYQKYNSSNIRPLSFSGRKEDFDIEEPAQNDNIQNGDEYFNEDEFTNKKTKSPNKVIIIKEKDKTFTDKVLDTAKYLFFLPFVVGKKAIQQPITSCLKAFSGIYFAGPLAPVAVLGGALYGTSKICNNLLATKSNHYESRKERLKNIGKGALALGLSLLFANRALKVAKTAGLAGVGSSISKLNVAKSFMKCVKLTPAAVKTVFSRAKTQFDLVIGSIKGAKLATQIITYPFKLFKYPIRWLCVGFEKLSKFLTMKLW